MRRTFLCAGSDECSGEKCTVAWNLVFQPKSLGGLGLHNLKLLNVALRTKWMWLSRTDDERPWARLNPTLGTDSVALFNASFSITMGSSTAILFWSDPWIEGLTAQALVPAVVALVRPHFVNRRRCNKDFLATLGSFTSPGRCPWTPLSNSSACGMRWLGCQLVQMVTVSGGSGRRTEFSLLGQRTGSFSKDRRRCQGLRMCGILLPR
jgi:hypothetical protein